MTLFLANRGNLQRKRLHDRIRQRLTADFVDVRRRRTNPREVGSYRVVGECDPRQYLSDDTYPATTARIEIGFQLRPTAAHDYYWFNWIEPDRDMLVGWHQDDTHPDLGLVHLQVNDASSAVAHHRARFLDAHPLAVVDHRLTMLPSTVHAVTWEAGRPVGIITENLAE